MKSITLANPNTSPAPRLGVSRKDADIAAHVWSRFAHKMDDGHSDFCHKADRCWSFYFGEQWRRADKERLNSERRPALTINKIRPTVNTVLAEQLYNRTEIGFVPRNQDATDTTADVLTKVFKQISDNNRLDYLRSEMFFDGVVTSRGFLDLRINFDDTMMGEVRATLLNPKNVVVDGDAESYDPDDWSDVTISKWATNDDISVLYGEGKADKLLGREHSALLQYGSDAIDTMRNRFGSQMDMAWVGGDATSDHTRKYLRNLRILDHQYRQLDRQKHFVARETGDTRQVPEGWDRDRIAKFVQMTGLDVIDRVVRRIRWSVVCDDVVLFDDWSPYRHFTIVPYFPIFSHGRTAGLVEDLLGPQELLNKVSSQELHVINTTANSGYIVKAGELVNMSEEQLRAQGSTTGVVITVKDDVDKAIKKITPNQVPQGLDRITFKAEESIKTISGINDSMQGFDREDVAAKAIDKKKQSGQSGLAKPLDNLGLTDNIMARNILALVQDFYTEERVIMITADQTTGSQERVEINKAAAGRIINDLTLGEYGVVTTNVPARESLQDSEFEQARSLRELGVQIPDETLVMTSRIRNKGELIRKITGDANSPEGQAKAQRAQRMEEATVSKLEGEAREIHTKADLNVAKAQETMTPEAPEMDNGADAVKNDTERQKAAADIDLRERELETNTVLKTREADRKDAEVQLKAQDMEQKRIDERNARAQEAAAAALQPQKGETV